MDLLIPIYVVAVCAHWRYPVLCVTVVLLALHPELVPYATVPVTGHMPNHALKNTPYPTKALTK